MDSPVELSAQSVGDGPPIVVLHGLFGSGRNWGGMARHFADTRRSHLLDARNHGQSPWAPSMTYPEMAGDVAAYIASRGLAPCDVLGHSMGGKTAMLLALTRPELVRRLIVVDIAPIDYRRGRADPNFGYARAMAALDLSVVRRRSEAEASLADSIPDPELRAFLVQNLHDDGDGTGFHWRVNLSAIQANLEALAGFPDVAGTRSGPTIIFAGELSDYVRPRDEPETRRLFPEARIVVVEGAGHWPHADQPERFFRLLAPELA